MVGVGARGPAWTQGGQYTPPHAHPHTLLAFLGSEPGGPPLDGPSLTVALDVVQAWAVLITVGFTLVMFVFLAFCVCAKKDDCYDEYELSQGITTVKVCHDGGENGLGGYPRINGASSPKGSDEASEASSRCTLKRELPAIPMSAHPDPVSECNVERTQSQHSSDLYAAVGEVDASGSMAKVIGGVQVLPSGAIGPGGRAAIVRDPSATSPTDGGAPGPGDTSSGPPGAVSHPYAKVKKNHPYAHVKLPKKEHPYAKVVRDDSEDPETDTDNYDDPKAIAKDKSWDNETVYEAAPPVPEKRSDLEEESLVATAPPDLGLMTTSATSASSALGPSSPRSPHLSTRTSITPSAHSPTSPHTAERPPSTDIPAAMAISGRTPANEELPYMTPPLHHQNGTAGIETQQNFSGDSQDSRGYTSISVREPLAALKAQTPTSTSTTATHPPEGEGYYMTVSDDDADEMYACIYEGTRGVGSETYAQIEPRTTPPPPPPSMPSPPHAPSTPSPLSTRGSSQPPPAPPSVDSLRHVVHSRQASSSSAASTVMGSPGAEKRGTRSPLPPLPQGDTSLYSAPSAPPPQPPHSPPRVTPTAVERPTQRALEEMYAKVMKKQRPGHSRGDSSGGAESDAGSVSSSRRGSVDVGGARWGSHTSTPPTTPRQSVDLGAMTHSLIETRNLEVTTNISRAKSYETTGSWSTGSTTQQMPNLNYETIPPTNFYSGGSSDPGYETVKNAEPPYASAEENYPGYETVKPTSDLESEPGYETLKHREYEGGYETVTSEKKQPSSEPGYETVAHEGRQVEDEPGYETVTHHHQEEAPYEVVQGKAAAATGGDPGYEELKGSVHHARTTSEHDPNYEQLKFTSRRSSDGDAEPGYEVVKKVETESTYELVSDYETQEKYPTYEKIDKPEKSPSPTESPMYASVIRKGSPEKKPTQETNQSLYAESTADEGPSPVGPRPADYDIMKDGDSDDDDIPLVLEQPSTALREIPSLLMESPSPPMKKSPSPVSSPPLMRSPEKDASPLVKSPEKDAPITKTPEDAYPRTKSPELESFVAKSPESESFACKSPEVEFSVTTSPLKESFSEEKPLETASNVKEISVTDIPPLAPVLGSLAQPVARPSQPESESEDEEPEAVKSPNKKTVMFDDSLDKTFSPSSDSSDEESLTDKNIGPAAQPKAGSPVREESTSGMESQSMYPSTQSPTKVADNLAQINNAAICDNAFDSSAANVNSEDLSKLPEGPAEALLIAHDSFGAQESTTAFDLQNAPETINPVYAGECSSLLQNLPHEITTTTQSVSPVICGDLPPPPPPPPETDEETDFPNDLPPPVADMTLFTTANDEAAEETPPPPLVAPSDVEGLEDMLNLAHMGSSSSGSTAGQLGSIHGSSEKDSDSPQECDETQIEGTIMADDLPPPPPTVVAEPEEQDSDEELDNSVSSGYEHGGFTAGGITVTVNPMADIEDTQELPDTLPPPPPTCEPTPVAPPSPIAVSTIVTSSAGSQSSSSGSGSQDTGSGSIESVVTVESVAQEVQRSTESYSSTDPNDQITQV